MCIEELIVELKTEIDKVDFTNFMEVDTSFNWVSDLVDELEDKQMRYDLHYILNDCKTHPLIQDSYFAMLDYLYKRS